MTPDDQLDDIRRAYFGDPADFIEGAHALTLDALLALVDRLRPAWHSEAACVGSRVDFTSPAKSERAQASATCGECSVREQCLEWALDIDDRHAILGGADPAARRAMQRNRGSAS